MGNTVGEEAREKERMGCWRGGSNIVYVTIYSQTGSRDDHGTVFFVRCFVQHRAEVIAAASQQGVCLS